MLIADDDDAVANLVERRWFAALAAVKAIERECDVLREVAELAAGAWRHARIRLVELESLSDALGRQLADSAGKQRPPLDSPEHGVLSAA